MDAMTLVSAWDALVHQLSYCFSQRTARTWHQIVSGWILNRGPATVTNIIRTLGDLADRHWTVYQKFFYQASWRLDAMSVQLLQRVIGPLIREQCPVDPMSGKPIADLVFDDTTLGRYGRHVAYASWYKDASASGPGHQGTVIHWAHNWLIGAVVLRLKSWPMLRWVLPAMFTLYRKRPDCDAEHPFQTRQEMAGEMAQAATEALPDVQWRFSGDGQYAARPVVTQLPPNANRVSRIRKDAAIYEVPQPPKKRPRGQNKQGRPPKKGKRMPTPLALARRRKNGWKTITAFKQSRKVQRLVLGITCQWYHVCKDVPVRLVIVRDPTGREDDDFFFCTDASVSEAEIVQRYYDRWGIEDAIFEGKEYLGFEDTRGWCPKTVLRQAPLAMILLTLVKVWYARWAPQMPSLLPKTMPWYEHKSHPSFGDMLSALRNVLWQHRISPNSMFLPRVYKIFKTVSFALTG
ncbi:MAG: transposase [Phycisphaerae bacterium]